MVLKFYRPYAAKHSPLRILDHLKGQDQVNRSPDQVDQTFLRTYKNQLHPIDIILVQTQREFCAYKKVLWDRSHILPCF